MGAVIALIARVNLEVDRHGTIGTDRQTINQLLEIGAMILAEAAEQLHRLGVLVRISAAEFNGSRIVVDLVGPNIKGLGCLHDQRRHQAGAIALEESIQGSAQSIIAQMLSGSKGRVVGLGPSFDAVKSVGFEQKAFEQQFEGVHIMRGLDLLTQELTQVQSAQEVGDYGSGLAPSLFG